MFKKKRYRRMDHAAGGIVQVLSDLPNGIIPTAPHSVTMWSRGEYLRVWWNPGDDGEIPLVCSPSQNYAGTIHFTKHHLRLESTFSFCNVPTPNWPIRSLARFVLWHRKPSLVIVIMLIGKPDIQAFFDIFVPSYYRVGRGMFGS